MVKQAIKERYPNGFERNGWTILNLRQGQNEYVRSKYTEMLRAKNKTAYADKMRMAANLDEIIQTADEVYREPARHKNAEAFNRGEIEIQVGQNFYEADVLTAIKADDREIFYDIVGIQPIKNEAPNNTRAESEDSRDRLLRASDESIAQNDSESKITDEPVKKSIRFQLWVRRWK